MRIAKFIFSFLITVGIIFALNTSMVYKGTPLPAFGKLLNPFTGFWQNCESPIPLPLFALSDSLLQAAVKVVYDDRRVPHIFAANDHDAHWVQGYITAKDRLWQMDFVTRSTSGRLSEILNDITVDDMKALQNNNYSLKAEGAMPIFLSRIKPETLNDGEKAVLELITKWDYKYDKQKLEPLYFEMWFKEFYQLTWDEISEGGADEKLLYPTEWRTLFILRDVPETNYFDIKATPERETAWDIIEKAFRISVKKVLAEIAERPDLNWSNYRNTTIAHLGQIPSFSTKNVYTDGQMNTLNAVRSNAGPSWRMVVELGDTTKAYVVYPGGQSGNPGSPYYDNFIDTWAAGKYYEAQFVKSPEDLKGAMILTQDFKTIEKE